MPLNLPAGATCFVDANIFYYHFVDVPPLSEASSEFLARVARGECAAFTSVHVLAETVHKVMLAEAAGRFGMNRAGLVIGCNTIATASPNCRSSAKRPENC
jgi:predicted nucleic acid-binding protein